MKSLWLCLAAFLLASCSGVHSGSGTTDPPPVQNVAVGGQWDAIATPTNTNFLSTNYYANITDQGGGNFFAAASSVIMCPGDDCGSFNTGASLTGKVSGMNITATLGTSTLTGTVSADGKTMSGTFTDPSGNGTWAAQKRGTITGNYTGSFNSIPHPAPFPFTVTASLTQAADFTVTGTASVTSSTCFTSLTFGTGSRAVGGAFQLVDSTHGVTIDVFANENGTLSLTAPFYGLYTITAGPCAGDIGTGSATKQ
jgi:hypothetical protein